MTLAARLKTREFWSFFAPVTIAAWHAIWFICGGLAITAIIETPVARRIGLAGPFPAFFFFANPIKESLLV